MVATVINEKIHDVYYIDASLVGTHDYGDQILETELNGGGLTWQQLKHNSSPDSVKDGRESFKTVIYGDAFKSDRPQAGLYRPVF